MPDKLRGAVLLNHLFCLLVFVGLKTSPSTSVAECCNPFFTVKLQKCFVD